VACEPEAATPNLGRHHGWKTTTGRPVPVTHAEPVGREHN